MELSPGGFLAFSKTEEASGLDQNKSEVCVKFVRPESGQAGLLFELFAVSGICAENACSVLASPKPGAVAASVL